MVYTVDNKTLKENIENHPDIIEDFGPMKVLGRKVDAVGNVYYRGRYVWKTQESAQKYTSDELVIFGVDADWNKDTIEVEGEDYRRLSDDAELINL